MITFSAITISDVFESITSVLGMIWSIFGNCVSTITGNPLLYVPVILGLATSAILGVVGLIRKMGVKGIGGGRRRRRR